MTRKFPVGIFPLGIFLNCTRLHKISVVLTSTMLIGIGLTGCRNNTVPTAAITYPVDGSRVYPGLVTFEGTVSDIETVDPTQLNASFETIDGSATCAATVDATGYATCQLPLDIEGLYEVKLHVVDLEQGLGSSVGVTVEVKDEPATVVIESPTDGQGGYTVVTPVTFIARVSDIDQPSGIAHTCIWTSSLTGVLGQSVVDLASSRCTLTVQGGILASGTHTISVEVTDEYGKPSTVSITLPVKPCTDNDKDGFSLECDPKDCNDYDPSVYSGAFEVCDGKDNDCDQIADDATDDDGDGFHECTGQLGGDCDDDHADSFPGAVEICDGKDNDCDTKTDEGFDQDDDNVSTCGGDCDDSNPDVFLEAPELCDTIDNDCDTIVDEGAQSTFYYDGDLDGFGNAANSVAACTQPEGTVTNDDDCNDADALINPAAGEICNGLDDNCSGVPDEGTIPFTYYLDEDNDGYGEAAKGTVEGCVQPTGYSAHSGDCNDADASISPGASEQCDLIDNNCNGSVDEGALITFYLDEDGDGYGVNQDTVEDCVAPEGYVALGGDCEDGDATTNPATPETCNALDDNCDNNIDEGLEMDTYYLDWDGDTYGDPNNFVVDCRQPDKRTTVSGDCNDSNASINPAATEVCDGLNNDCDGEIDEGVKNQYWIDSDNDTYGSSSASPILGCTTPAGYVANNKDCSDSQATVYPGAEEECDGFDNNCDGTIDNDPDLTLTIFFQDADRDGYGTSTSYIYACATPVGYASNSSDCNDKNATVYPSAPESCDSLDNDCDSIVDEGTNCFDDDGDGYTENNGDCNDQNAGINPAVAEVSTANGVDEDCDGIIDENTDCWDDDHDGYIERSSATSCPGYSKGAYGSTIPGGNDCNDAVSTIYPTAPERFNGLDDNCDGTIDGVIDLAQGAVTFGGDRTNAHAGEVVTGIGDFNGDGFGEIAVGAPARDNNIGAVYVVFGKSTGFSSDALNTVGVVLSGDGTGDQGEAGYTISGHGDWNADGLADFAVGEPYRDGTVVGFTNAGHLYVIYGKTSGLPNSSLTGAADAFTEGLIAGVLLGSSAAANGDFDGDGYDDIAFGGPWPGATSTGYLMVLFGGTTKYAGYQDLNTIWSATGDIYDSLGTAVAFAGNADDDGDDSDDLLASGYGSTVIPPSYSNAGVTYFVPGNPGFDNGQDRTISDIASAEWRGESDNEEMGRFLSSAGDVNQDGYADFLIGREDQTSDSQNLAYLILGPDIPGDGYIQSVAGVQFSGDSDVCPCPVSGGFDVNNDGFDDILIGTGSADLNGSNSGAAYLFYGDGQDWSGDYPVEEAAAIFRGAAEDQAGSSVSILGDINGDGYADIAVGAPGADYDGVSDAGRIYVMFGFAR